jgi:hypothetical protein
MTDPKKNASEKSLTVSWMRADGAGGAPAIKIALIPTNRRQGFICHDTYTNLLENDLCVRIQQT